MHCVVDRQRTGWKRRPACASIGGAGMRRSVDRWAVGLVVLVVACASAGAAQAKSSPLRDRVRALVRDQNALSQGARAWLNGPKTAPNLRALAPPSFGNNVDANDPAHDLAAGQSETAIAAQRSSTGHQLVLEGWNDASAFLFVNTTDRRASGTGIAVSGDGARHFTDLIGLPNNNVDQQWQGDPAVVSLGDGRDFAVASLYFPSLTSCADGLPAELTIAVTIARVSADGKSATFSAPTPVARAGDACDQEGDPNLALLDKDWISYDRTSRTLAVSYTRFKLAPGASGLGQIEVVRAKLPADPRQLRPGGFSAPRVIWPEEPPCDTGVPSTEATRCGAVNEGAYVTAVPGGDTYVAWERNVDSISGDPYGYIHAAYLPATAARPTVGGPAARFVVSTGQPNGNSAGGVKSLNNVVIAGYNRGLGNDFPRLAYDGVAQRLLVEWNDASLHPLGDIWLRALRLKLAGRDATSKVNDDNSFALHFLPAVS